MPPCSARGWLVVEDEGVDTGPEQVERGRQTGLASSDNHRLVVVWAVVDVHGDPDSLLAVLCAVAGGRLGNGVT